MSILKGIMHHWNKTKNDYDVIHPETDYKKITDWNEGIVATLASTGLGTLVNTLTSDSLLATMIQKVLTATGVKYNIAQNGYLCFGSLFGGLIIQWGYAYTANGVYRTGTLPISFQEAVFCCVATMVGYSVDTSIPTVFWNDQNTTISQVQFRLNGTTYASPAYIIVGK